MKFEQMSRTRQRAAAAIHYRLNPDFDSTSTVEMCRDTIQLLGIRYCPNGIPADECKGRKKCGHAAAYPIEPYVAIDIDCHECGAGEAAKAKTRKKAVRRAVRILEKGGWIPHPEKSRAMVCGECAADWIDDEAPGLPVDKRLTEVAINRREEFISEQMRREAAEPIQAGDFHPPKSETIGEPPTSDALEILAKRLKPRIDKEIEAAYLDGLGVDRGEELTMADYKPGDFGKGAPTVIGIDLGKESEVPDVAVYFPDNTYARQLAERLKKTGQLEGYTVFFSTDIRHDLSFYADARAKATKAARVQAEAAVVAIEAAVKESDPETWKARLESKAKKIGEMVVERDQMLEHRFELERRVAELIEERNQARAQAADAIRFRLEDQAGTELERLRKEVDVERTVSAELASDMVRYRERCEALEGELVKAKERERFPVHILLTSGPEWSLADISKALDAEVVATQRKDLPGEPWKIRIPAHEEKVRGLERQLLDALEAVRLSMFGAVYLASETPSIEDLETIKQAFYTRFGEWPISVGFQLETAERLLVSLSDRDRLLATIAGRALGLDGLHTIQQQAREAGIEIYDEAGKIRSGIFDGVRHASNAEARSKVLEEVAQLAFLAHRRLWNPDGSLNIHVFTDAAKAPAPMDILPIVVHDSSEITPTYSVLPRCQGATHPPFAGLVPVSGEEFRVWRNREDGNAAPLIEYQRLCKDCIRSLLADGKILGRRQEGGEDFGRNVKCADCSSTRNLALSIEAGAVVFWCPDHRAARVGPPAAYPAPTEAQELADFERHRFGAPVSLGDVMVDMAQEAMGKLGTPASEYVLPNPDDAGMAITPLEVGAEFAEFRQQQVRAAAELILAGVMLPVFVDATTVEPDHTCTNAGPSGICPGPEDCPGCQWLDARGENEAQPDDSPF